MRLFVDGTDLRQLPELLQVVARFRFPLVSERWIEGRHARMHKFAKRAPHSSPTHLAFYSIQPRLRQMAQQMPREFESLANCCGLVPHAMRAVEASGLLQHPAVQWLMEQKSHRMNTRKLVDILFHVDSPTLFQNLPDSSSENQGVAQRPLGPGDIYLVHELLWLFAFFTKKG